MTLRAPIPGAPSVLDALDARVDDLEAGSLGETVSVTDPTYGAVGDGVANDTTALNAAWDALPSSGGHLVLPAGQYKHTALSWSSKDDVTIEFQAGAWLAPSSGLGLTFTSCQRLKLFGPRFRLNSGSTATGFLKFDTCTRGAIYDPVCWSFINIPANFDCIWLTNDSYWTEVIRPRIRKDSGGLTGTFRRGVFIDDVTNAARVLGGDINHCDDGVRLDSVNACVIDGTAFETCTDGVEIAGTSNPGTQVLFTRAETGTNHVNISQSTTTAFQIPITIRGIKTVSSVTNEITNTNSVPIDFDNGTKRSVQSPNLNGTTQAVQLQLRNSDNQTVPVIEVLGRLGGGRIAEIDKNGNLILASDSAAVPAPTGDVGIIHHRSSLLKLIAFDDDATSSRVQLVIGNGSGGFTIVAEAVNGQFRSGVDGVADLGANGQRWRNAYLSGAIKPGFQALATDAAFTLTPVTSPQNTLHTGTLTADRTVTLSTTGAVAGMIFGISRSGGGAFNLNVGSGPLKALATDQWCEVIYDGSAWVLYQAGART